MQEKAYQIAEQISKEMDRDMEKYFQNLGTRSPQQLKNTKEIKEEIHSKFSPLVLLKKIAKYPKNLQTEIAIAFWDLSRRSYKPVKTK